MRSALTLFVLRVFTNDHDFTMSFDDLAFLADSFDGRLNFHFLTPFLSEMFTSFSR